MKLLRRVGPALAGLLAGLLVLAAMLALAALEDHAAVAGKTSVSTSDVERALQLMRKHDPRKQRPDVVRVVAAQTSDLELLLNHAASGWPGLAARVRIDQDSAEVNASLAEPLGIKGRWVNVSVLWRASETLPEVDRMRVGKLPVPSWCAAPLLDWFLARRGLSADTHTITRVLRRVDLRPGRVLVFYALQQDTQERLLGALVPPAEQQRLRAYSDHIVALLAHEARGSNVSMSKLLPPLIDLARQRSAQGNDAALENRAAILALAFYANQLGLEAIVPQARSWPQATPVVVTLAGRSDLPLHYLISAALASTSGTSLADAVGLYKEMSDSRGGSGFSFNDLAADRAGTRFGERAMSDAARLQAQLAPGLGESGLLPRIDDLPEALQAGALTRRFGGVGGDAYKQMLVEIESRLDTVSVLR